MLPVLVGGFWSCACSTGVLPADFGKNWGQAELRGSEVNGQAVAGADSFDEATASTSGSGAGGTETEAATLETSTTTASGDDTQQSTSAGEVGGDGFDDGAEIRFDLVWPEMLDDGGDHGDPQSCAEAENERSYVGCDFWPTVTYNPVLENFDFAAAVANASNEDAEVIVLRDGREIARVQVPAGGLEKITLPWVRALKGPQFDAQTTGPRPKSSVLARAGAYHLVSDVPVTVWQFNPLQYTDELSDCALVQDINLGEVCLSLSNDASLLIPTPAMRGVHRVIVKDSAKGSEGGFDDTPGSVAITATQDATRVEVRLPASVGTAAGPGVPEIAPGGQAEFELDAGDVLQLMASPGPWWGEPHHDLSGALISGDAAIQVIATVALTTVPSPEVQGEGYADHLEELVLPAEVLGARYIVAPPSSSRGQNIGHHVRFVGNFDNTRLRYSGGPPSPDAPRRLDAGQVASFETDRAFEVTADQAFAVASFGRGGQRHTPGEVPTIGDPAYTISPAVEQFRSRYIFLAPADYPVSFADILAPAGAELTLDGRPLQSQPQPVPGSDWQIYREPLDGSGSGAHLLLSHALNEDGKPLEVGLQVMGYGHATGYMYPGGLNLDLISDPPE